jgi:hypothetical protein
MSVHRYLLRADLRGRWRSLALLTLLIAVVVAGVLTALGGARRTESSFELMPIVIAVLAQIGASLSRRAAGRVSTAVALRTE